MKNILLKLILAVTFMVPAFVVAQEKTNVWERAAYGSAVGITYVDLLGNNGAPTTSAEPFWPQSEAYTVLAANMSSPYVASSNANDAAAGTGARTIRVTCVDSAFAETTADYTLIGQTSVALTQSCMVINKIEVLTAGSGAINAGIIRIGTGTNTSGVPAVTHGHAAAGVNQSESGIYAVPTDKTLLCRNLTFSSIDVTSTESLNFYIDTYTSLGIRKRATLPGIHQIGTNPAVLPKIWRFPEETVIVFQSRSAASTGPVYMSVECIRIDTNNLNQTYF